MTHALLFFSRRNNCMEGWFTFSTECHQHDERKTDRHKGQPSQIFQFFYKKQNKKKLHKGAMVRTVVASGWGDISDILIQGSAQNWKRNEQNETKQKQTKPEKAFGLY